MIASLVIGTLLCLVLLLAALPLLAAFDLEWLKLLARRAAVWGRLLAALAGGGSVLALFLGQVQDRDRLEIWGRVYASALHALLAVDLLIGVLAGLLAVWPKGGAVALAAFREAIRQPLFWCLAGVTILLLLLSLFLPYYTFGDDYKFMKLIGFDLLMLVPGLFGVVTAAMTITEEIEGRTAVTLISKPVSRRQFLLGKYLGILLAAVALTALLAWFFEWCLYFKPIIDPSDEAADPLRDQIQPWLGGAAQAVATGDVGGFLQGIALWFSSALAGVLGQAIGSCQLLILTALAAALATRLPLVVNLGACLLLFFLGHLAPVLVEVSARLQQRFAADNAGAPSAALELVQFLARLLDTVLPALDFFNLGPAVIRDRPLPLGEYAVYVASVVGYSLLYAAIALLLGLILFEDRDLT